MNLARLIYKSTANDKTILNESLKALEEQASKNNEGNDITGLLVLSGNTFVQVLEGNPATLTTVFGKIAADTRHSNVELISFESIWQRSFDQWRMRLIDLFDIPGEKRTYLKSKYKVEDDNIVIPSDLYQLYALLFDARDLSLIKPWKDD